MRVCDAHNSRERFLMNFILLFLRIIIIWARSWENLFMRYANIRAAWSAPLLLYNISSFFIWNFKPLASFSVAAQAGLSLTQYNNNNFFHEDNMFGMNASLAYGPQLQRHTCVW